MIRVRTPVHAGDVVRGADPGPPWSRAGSAARPRPPPRARYGAHPKCEGNVRLGASSWQRSRFAAVRACSS